MGDEKECMQSYWQTEVRNDPHRETRVCAQCPGHLALILLVCMEKAIPDAGLALLLMGSGIEISCLFCIVPSLASS